MPSCDVNGPQSIGATHEIVPNSNVYERSTTALNDSTGAAGSDILHTERLSSSISASTSAKLLKTYFTSIHPHWPLIYKPQYQLTGLENMADAIPEAVLCAIYSISACILRRDVSGAATVTSSDVPYPEVLYIAALKALQEQSSSAASLYNGLLQPSITACQTLTILSLQQHGVAEFSSAALLISLAAAMAIELRLHRKNTSGDAVEVQVSSRLWWTIFVLEKLMSCEMGRPMALSINETDALYPSVLEADEYEMLPISSSASDKPALVKLYTLSGFTKSIQTSIVLEKISREVYSIAGQNAIRQDRRAGEATRRRLWNELLECRVSLESSPLAFGLYGDGHAAPVAITNMVVSSSLFRASSWHKLTAICDDRCYGPYVSFYIGHSFYTGRHGTQHCPRNSRQTHWIFASLLPTTSASSSRSTPDSYPRNLST